jgi:hypothetical protein
MDKWQMIYRRVAILMTALLYGMIEGFIFDHGFHPGAPTLFHVFSAGYHLPMAFLMIFICFGFKNWQMMPAWVLMEDVCFWIFSGQYNLDSSSWISMGLGGIHFSLQMFLPFTYIILIVIWLGLERAKILIESLFENI